MGSDLEQVIAVVFMSFLVFLLLTQDPPMALQVFAAFVSFFISILVYEQFLKGGRGAVSIAGRSEITKVAIVFFFFWGAVLGSSYISSVLPGFLLGYLPGSTLNSLQDFGISFFFSVLTFIGMRLMYYRNRPMNMAAWALIVIMVAFFSVMYYTGWSLHS
jgi:hypothetical protein